MFDPEIILRRKGRWQIGGAPEGHDARLIGALALKSTQGLLHIARDDQRMSELSNALAFFTPGVRIHQLPAWDCLPYDRVSPHGDLVCRRMHTLCHLPSKGLGPGEILITTVNAILQRLPAKASLAQATFIAKVGARIDRTYLTDYLTRNGYNRVSTVMESGEYAVRGGLIDIYPPGLPEPLRLDLFGDTLEGLRHFDPISQRSSTAVAEFALAPVSEVILDAPSIERFRSGYRHHFGAVVDNDPLYGSISEGRKFVGMEHWLPLFHEKLDTVFDYAPGAMVTLDHLALEAREERCNTIADYFEARETARKSGLSDSGHPYKPLRPELLYLTEKEWVDLTADRPIATFHPFTLPTGQPLKRVPPAPLAILRQSGLNPL